MKLAKLATLALATLLALAVTLWANNATRTTASFHIAPFQVLSLGSGPAGAHTTAVEIPQPTASDLARGHVDIPDALTLTVHSNAPWVVNVRALSPHMGRSRDGRVTKALSDFQLRTGGRDYVTITTQDQPLLRGNHGRFQSGVDYRVNFDPATHRDGDYALDLLYTITSR